MFSNRVAVLMAAPFFLMLTGLAVAAEAPADIADVWIVEVNAGMDDKFTNALKAHMQYRVKKGDTRAYRTYTPVIGDDLNYYVIRYCCTGYDDMDAYREWAQKAKAGDNWNENVDPYVAGYRHYLERVDFANSNWPEEDPGFQLYGVTTYKHKMGTSSSIEAAKKALADAAKAGKWQRHWSFMRDIGGDGSVGLVSPFIDYKDMKPPEESFSRFLTRTQGAEKAGAMLAAWTDNFESTNYTVYRYMPDLSMDTMQ